jgi:DNA-binding CsgD family transcriptional regulator
MLDHPLTPRQRECISLVREGLSSKEIARKLGISHRTVEAHIEAVMSALEVNSRMAAVFRLEEMDGRALSAPPSCKPDRGIMLKNPDNSLCDDYLFATHRSERIESSSFAILPPIGGETIDAPRSIRLRWMARLAALAIMASCFVIVFIMGLSDMVR